MKFIRYGVGFIIACLYFAVSSCESELESVTVKVIDAETKKPLENYTIDIRIEKFGFPIKRFVLVGRYFSNSKGEAKINVEKDELYHVIVSEHNRYGSTEFDTVELTNGKLVTVEVISLDDR